MAISRDPKSKTPSIRIMLSEKKVKPLNSAFFFKSQTLVYKPIPVSYEKSPKFLSRYTEKNHEAYRWRNTVLVLRWSRFFVSGHKRCSFIALYSLRPELLLHQQSFLCTCWIWRTKESGSTSSMFIAALDKIEAFTWNQRKFLFLVFHD